MPTGYHNSYAFFCLVISAIAELEEIDHLVLLFEILNVVLLVLPPITPCAAVLTVYAHDGHEGVGLGGAIKHGKTALSPGLVESEAQRSGELLFLEQDGPNVGAPV